MVKDIEEPISCRFYQQIDGEDVRLDSENKADDFTTSNEQIVTKLRHAKGETGSQMVKVIAFCTNQSGKDRIISTVNIFLKPSPTDVKNVEFVENSAPAESMIDRAGMEVFGKDLNDRQLVAIFTDMFD